MINRRQFALTALAASFAACAKAEGANDPYPYAHLGESAPGFAAPLYGGGSTTLNSYRGKTLVLAFGGLWCPDCVVEEQELNQIAQLAASASDVAFLAVHSGDRFGRWGRPSQDVSVASEAVAAYWRETDTEYPLAFDLSSEIADAYALEWFPTILIIGQDGVIRNSTSDLRLRTVRRFWREVQGVVAGSL